MKLFAITIIVNLTITVALLSLYKDRVVQPMINYYDTYMHSVSGWICTSYEPSTAHPELSWDWSDMTYETHIICHGENQYPL